MVETARRRQRLHARGVRRDSAGGRSSSLPLPYVLERLAVYVVAILPMLALYATRQRALVIGPPIALIGGIACWYLLRHAALPRNRRLLNAAVVAGLLLEIVWVLGYWPVPPLIGGAVLWLAFYVLSGVVEHAATDALDRPVAQEYAAVAAIGLLLTIVTALWRG